MRLTKPEVIFGVILILGLAYSGVNGNHRHRNNEATIDKLWKDTLESSVREFELTFMASGRNFKLASDFLEINSKLTMFYKTAQSDLNNQSTEVILNKANPDWMTVFKVKTSSSDDQIYLFKVKHIDERGQSELIGEAKVEIQEIWTTMNANQEVTLKFNSGFGHLILTKTETITFKLSAVNLAKQDTFGGKSDPYVKCLWSRGPDGPEMEFFRTSWVGNVVDPEWMEIIAFEGYQRGSDQYLHFKLYDDDGITSDDYLGEAFLKIDDHLKAGNKVRVVTLMNEPKKKTGKGSLIITFLQTAEPTPEPNPGFQEISNEWFYQ